MVRSCCVRGCSNSSLSRKLFSIPCVVKSRGKQTEELTARRRREWLAQLQLKHVTFETTTRNEVCADHFVGGQPAYMFDVNSPSWKPTLKLGHMYSQSVNPDRYDRQMKRTAGKEPECILHCHKETAFEVPVGAEPVVHVQGNESGTYTQTEGDFCFLSVQEETMLRDELQRLTLENMTLKEEIAKKMMTLESLSEKDDTVKYFTGISSYITLLAVFEFVQPYLPTHSRRTMGPFQAFLLTLMHMRLNTPVTHLAFIFGISRVTAAKTFHETLGILFQILKPLVYWPDRQAIKVSLPEQFLSHPWCRVVSIIDCFEVFIERSSCPIASATTWSNYKHNHTIKYLISITPQGFISFVSKGWRGRASDKRITQDCGYLDNLLPNDLILADRGFDIAEIVGRRGAEVKIPAFTKGKSQLSAPDLESTRTLASLRIHVERVIGVLCSKFTILNSVIPIEHLYKLEDQDLTTLDQIVLVGCALVNVCDGIC